ncbi:Helicase-like protein [Heracleum sosnowskyi]|uniref:Helicase-like protein n=1 Tax=Heracleum sosnowskyi TaxID=360622 RepID=A0AAD8MFG6_9APIA|nr:Helicase-like protein [Heracleum sosnowskyi]
MQQNFQDSIAVCKEYGHPDIFITFTCNPKWVEIQQAVTAVGSQDASVRPDLVARVFKMKLDAMMSDLTKKDVLGRVLAVVYTIEFQKRGLPHAHIVLWMAEGDKLLSTEDIDTIISAELPDKETDAVGYEAVSQFMMHGPCGEANPRQNTGIIVERNKIHLDNRHVVPYNRGLLVKYQAHINVERFCLFCPKRAVKLSLPKVVNIFSLPKVVNINFHTIPYRLADAGGVFWRPS